LDFNGLRIKTQRNRRQLYANTTDWKALSIPTVSANIKVNKVRHFKSTPDGGGKAAPERLSSATSNTLYTSDNAEYIPLVY